MADEVNAVEAVKEEVAVQSAPEVSATEDTTEVASEQPIDTGEFSSENLKTESSEEASPTEESEELKPRGAEKRKQQLEGEIKDLQEQVGIDPNTEIRDLVSARNALRKTVSQVNNQAYRPASENELLDQVNPATGDYFTPVEAQVAQMQQQQALDRYNNEVAETQLYLQSDAQRALRDFPMFDADSSDYNPQVAAQVDQLLGQSLKIDPNTGQVVGSTVSPYQLYKTVHDTYAASSAQGQIEGQRATERMLASADNVGGAPRQAEVPFAKLTLEEQRAHLRKKGHDV